MNAPPGGQMNIGEIEEVGEIEPLVEPALEPKPEPVPEPEPARAPA
jgi:hypothetical protein